MLFEDKKREKEQLIKISPSEALLKSEKDLAKDRLEVLKEKETYNKMMASVILGQNRVSRQSKEITERELEVIRKT